MSFSASFNGRPLTSNTTRKTARKTVKSDFPTRTPGYYNVLKNAHGSASAFAKALAMLSKGNR